MTSAETGEDGGVAPRLHPWIRRFRPVFVVAVVVGLAIQLVPYGWTRSNPPITDPVSWESAQVEAVVRASCYDCHSNETDWPLYSYVAPMSWLVRSDVEAGRDELNFSEWDDHDSEADDAADEVIVGSMPPERYTRLHPDAALDDVEKRLLIEAFQALDDD